MNFSTNPDVDRALALDDDVTDRIGDAEAVLTGLRELKERIDAGNIGQDARTDLAGDLLAALERLNAYAVAVLG